MPCVSRVHCSKKAAGRLLFCCHFYSDVYAEHIQQFRDVADVDDAVFVEVIAHIRRTAGQRVEQFCDVGDIDDPVKVDIARQRAVLLRAASVETRVS